MVDGNRETRYEPHKQEIDHPSFFIPPRQTWRTQNLRYSVWVALERRQFLTDGLYSIHLYVFTGSERDASLLRPSAPLRK